jgi:hypothetical protein
MIEQIANDNAAERLHAMRAFARSSLLLVRGRAGQQR